MKRLNWERIVVITSGPEGIILTRREKDGLLSFPQVDNPDKKAHTKERLKLIARLSVSLFTKEKGWPPLGIMFQCIINGTRVYFCTLELDDPLYEQDEYVACPEDSLLERDDFREEHAKILRLTKRMAEQMQEAV